MSQMVKNTPAKQEPPVQFLGLEVMLEKGLPTYPVFLGFPYGSLVKNLPAMWETSIRFLGSEDPLEEGMATHSSILAQKNPHGQRSLAGYSPRIGHDQATEQSIGIQK